MIEVTVKDRVLEILINRPEAKNALTLSMYESMTEALERATSDEGVRAVLIHGGGGVFTAGNDLGDFMENPPAGEESPVYKFLKVIASFEKPLIAAVRGWAVGIGTTMLLHCDLVYAAPDAKFKMPFVDLALVPEAGSSLILPRMMGHQKAAEILFFSKKVSAAEADRLGFVSALIEDGDVLEHARERAVALTKLAPKSLRLTKMLLHRAHHSGLEESMSEEGSLFTELLSSPEFAEAVSAFFEKRAPDFG